MAKEAQVQTAVDFVQTIADLKNGKALIDCSRKLTKLVAAEAPQQRAQAVAS